MNKDELARLVRLTDVPAEQVIELFKDIEAAMTQEYYDRENVHRADENNMNI